MELFNEPIIQKKTLGDVIKNDNVITNSTMVGGSFNGGKITIGSGNNIFTANKDGIFLGSSSFSTAPFSVNMLGDVVANSITITGGSLDGTTTIGGRLCSTVAEAIDANGHFIDERFDTDSKTILSDFTFGTSGALQIGTYENGVSGDIRISSNGILGRNKDGDTTFSINGTTGDATFGGTLVAASGTFGTVTAGILSGVEISGSTITGGTIQTATSGQRVAIASSDNTITFYNSSNTAITQLGGGDDIGTALRINLDSSTTNGILISANNTTGGNGFYYTNASNVRSRGLYIKKTSTGANNDYPAIEVEESGSGEIMYCDIKGSGAGIELWRTSGTGTDYSLKISTSIAYNTKGLLVEKTSSTGTGTLGEFYSQDGGITLDVNSTKSTSSNVALRVQHASNSADAMYISKTNSQNVLNIAQSVNNGENCIGIKMDIANAGAGKEYAFEFAGSEYIAGATGVSGLTGVIRILTSDGLCYIPVYSSYS